MGTLEDVANDAEFLASDLAAFVSGQHLLHHRRRTGVTLNAVYRRRYSMPAAGANRSDAT